MLPKQNRLTKSEVEHVVKYGKILRTPHCYIRYSTAVNGGEIQNKFAVIVAKKVEKTSVKRHAMRRAVYRELQHVYETLPQRGVHVAITMLLPDSTLRVQGAYQTVVHALRKSLFEV
jgi:RNase P protein component